ncbi:hypothetical protein KKD70_02395 [Patescibacteria group bacterium]|nr:hypothetical protein [Patescibacteria group bacterium]
MNKYIFVLGRKWKLCAAELIAVLGADNVTDLSQEILVKDFAHELEDPQALLDGLGGTIKIAQVFAKVNNLDEVQKVVVDHLKENRDGKLIFALGLYNFAHTYKIDLRNLLKNVKNGLRDGGKVRFLNSPTSNVKSAVARMEKLDLNGTDISVFRTENGKYLVAHSVAIQDFKQYSLRDYDRPGRDAKSGMLPPKLAQIMINLACGSEKCKVYDPFCGSGTVLMEGALLGHKMTGSDISEKAIIDSRKNIDWLAENFEIGDASKMQIFVKDATRIESKDLDEKPDHIVCETYLGPPVSKCPLPKTMEIDFKEIQAIIIGALRALKPILNAKSNVVMVVPFYRDGGKRYFLENLVEKIKELGYDVADLFPEEFEKTFEITCTRRGSLTYDRTDQTVGREIFRFVLKN